MHICRNQICRNQNGRKVRLETSGRGIDAVHDWGALRFLCVGLGWLSGLLLRFWGLMRVMTSAVGHDWSSCSERCNTMMTMRNRNVKSVDSQSALAHAGRQSIIVFFLTGRVLQWTSKYGLARDYVRFERRKVSHKRHLPNRQDCTAPTSVALNEGNGISRSSTLPNSPRHSKCQFGTSSPSSRTYRMGRTVR
jgi:hypothetical protein